MKLIRFWSGLAVFSLVAAPIFVLAQRDAQAAGTNPRAEWRAPTTKKAVAKVAPKVSKAAEPVTPAPAVETASQPNAPSTKTATSSETASQEIVVDQSQVVLDIDLALAASIASGGPKSGYAGALSQEGVLYDANGASPTGAEAANSRFGTFPADVTFVRTPERALAAGGSGSSWGTYTIKRGETVLSAGRYISVWRKEASGWKMVSELAAGKAPSAPSSAAGNGVLPKRPVSPGRAPPSPFGVPLTIPVAPQNPATSTPASPTLPPSR